MGGGGRGILRGEEGRRGTGAVLAVGAVTVAGLYLRGRMVVRQGVWRAFRRCWGGRLARCEVYCCEKLGLKLALLELAPLERREPVGQDLLRWRRHRLVWMHFVNKGECGDMGVGGGLRPASLGFLAMVVHLDMRGEDGGSAVNADDGLGE